MGNNLLTTFIAFAILLIIFHNNGYNSGYKEAESDFKVHNWILITHSTKEVKDIHKIQEIQERIFGDYENPSTE